MHHAPELPERLRVGIPAWVSMYFRERLAMEREIEQELDPLAKRLGMEMPGGRSGIDVHSHVEFLARVARRNAANEVACCSSRPLHLSWGARQPVFFTVENIFRS